MLYRYVPLLGHVFCDGMSQYYFACGLGGSVLVHVGLTCASVAFEAGVDKSSTCARRRICNLVCWFALRICILKSTCAVMTPLFVYFYEYLYLLKVDC